ncbi:MAG: Trk system potassium transporter TrkA [Lachnospiraceae bacterium]|nr:Trk system potassium transporter TrkA [Lachnospiraceae bacterium]
MFGMKSSTAKRPLHIVIVGAGKVGTTLVEQLSKEGNEISLIDSDAAKVDEINNLYDVLGIVGNGASTTVLKEAGIQESDLFIAVTESDELNLLCCTVATMTGTKDLSAIARVRTPDYSRDSAYLRDKLGLAMIINPELEASNEIARILNLPAALEVNSFAHGTAELIKLKLKDCSSLTGKSVIEFSQEKHPRMLFCAVERNGEVVIPYGSFRFEESDVVSFVCPKRSAANCLRSLGIATNQTRDCLIVGGGKASYYLAKRLLADGIDVKIIEWNRERCEELTDLIPEAIIINGDGTDAEILKEAGIDSVDAFIPLTGIDEENVLLTLHAKQVSNAKVVTKVNRFSFKNVINTLELDSVVFPRLITSEAIIAYARAKRASIDSNVETISHIFDERAEAIEFHVGSESAITSTPLMNLEMKKNLMIAFISRGKDIIFPSGSDTIEVGDNVMVVTTETGFTNIQDILV